MPPVPVLKAWRKQRRGFGKLTPHGTLGGSDPTIDAGGGRRRTLVDLEANVVEECGLGQGVLGDGGGLMRRRPPAQKMQQIVGITPQRGISHATDSLLVQISIDPLHFLSGLLDHAKRTMGIAQAALLSYMESHRAARFNRA